jgi:hypothetical protein
MIKEYRPSGGSTMLDPDTAKRIKAEAKRQEARARRVPRPAPAPADDDEVPMPKAAVTPGLAIVRARAVMNWGSR